VYTFANAGDPGVGFNLDPEVHAMASRRGRFNIGNFHGNPFQINLIWLQ
jgi:hypothetical protein